MRTEIGATVRLIRMEDPYSIPSGSIGTVTGIDCNGTPMLSCSREELAV